MSGAALASAGIVGGAAVLGVAGLLLHRTLRPTLEIARYAQDIAEAIDAIARNTEGAAELRRTREVALAAPGLVRALGEGS